MRKDPRQFVVEAATGFGISPELQDLATVICELRGHSPWEQMTIGGFAMTRWQAVIAEIRIFREAM